MIREDFSITNALVGLCTLFVLVYLTSVVSHRSKKAEGFLEGKPTILVDQGKLVPENLNLERIPPNEVYGEMHKMGLARLETGPLGDLGDRRQDQLRAVRPTDV
jgi:uncharacterized membrane protein YcaP (DUF421 family)